MLASYHAGVSLAAPVVLRAVAGTGLCLTLVGLLGLAHEPDSTRGPFRERYRSASQPP
jgi:hypothetical protein